MTPVAPPHPDVSVLPPQTHLALAAYPSAAPCARGHVQSVTLEWGLAELAGTAELLASELVTNAIQASQRLRMADTPVIQLWLVLDSGSIFIHVWDASSEIPVHRHSAPDEEDGRGLMLVEALGKDWGVYKKDGGKVVWVQITGDL